MTTIDVDQLIIHATTRLSASAVTGGASIGVITILTYLGLWFISSGETGAKIDRAVARDRYGQGGFGNARCRFHGGLSSGPKTEASRIRIADAQRPRWCAYREGRKGGAPKVQPGTPMMPCSVLRA